MSLELTPLDVAQLSPAVARVAGPDAQGPTKMMAAKGLAPMGPRDLMTVLYQLSFDLDEKIATAAREKAASLPENILGPALADPLDARILHYYAISLITKPLLIEKILLNRSTHDETFVLLASSLSGQLLEILAGNQERLLRHPAIIEALFFNKEALQSTVERLIEQAVRNGLTLERIPQFKEIAASILGTAETPAVAEDVPSSDVLDAVFSQALSEGSEETEPTPDELDKLDEHAESEITPEKEQENEKKKKATPVQNLSLVAKIRLASIGNATCRAILVRDSNRLVSMATIKAQGISDQEAARYAKNPSVSEDVIRYIAAKKEWQKCYAVKASLAHNPKCPLGHTMNILPHLRANDLRELMRSKNIPAAVSKAAKEIIRKRGG